MSSESCGLLIEAATVEGQEETDAEDADGKTESQDVDQEEADQGKKCALTQCLDTLTCQYITLCLSRLLCTTDWFS